MSIKKRYVGTSEMPEMERQVKVSLPQKVLDIYLRN
jgi:hypothetical protein